MVHFLEACSEQSKNSHRESRDSHLTLELGKCVREKHLQVVMKEQYQQDFLLLHSADQKVLY